MMDKFIADGGTVFEPPHKGYRGNKEYVRVDIGHDCISVPKDDLLQWCAEYVRERRMAYWNKQIKKHHPRVTDAQIARHQLHKTETVSWREVINLPADPAKGDGE